MIFQLLQFVIAILLVVIFWELSKIHKHSQKDTPIPTSRTTERTLNGSGDIVASIRYRPEFLHSTHTRAFIFVRQ
jgi:uncharacterized membrane protein